MALCSFVYLPQLISILWCLSVILTAADVSVENEDKEGFIPVFEDEFSTHICEEPPPPLNGELLCGKHKRKQNKYVCKAQCDDGFQFPNGKAKARHICDMSSGKWTPTYIFPNCNPICSPACENEGECIDGNQCVCTAKYRGDRCQFALDLCEPIKDLHVSADWSCNHTKTETICAFECPQGTRSESHSEKLYHCSLDGTWTPSFAPKCVPINVLEAPVMHNSIKSSRGQYYAKTSKSTCSLWGSTHVRTFDGGVYSFEGHCSYLLSKDCEQNTYEIHIQNLEPCESTSSCRVALNIYIGSYQYVLSSGLEGPSVQFESQMLPIPTVINGLLFQMLSDYVTVKSSLGFSLKWNMKNGISLSVSNHLKNKTCGLCGRFDDSILNDLELPDGTITDNVEGFVNSWNMENLGEKCLNKVLVKDYCSANQEKAKKSDELCGVIFNEKFSSCHQLIDANVYYEACKMDHCSCTLPENSCYCDSLAEYFKECVQLGGIINGGWRDEYLCPLSCKNGMIYNDCGSSCPKTCKNTVYDCEDDHCVDGCHCPDGTILHNGQCVDQKSCPCFHNDKEHAPGSRILQDCNACECVAGKWECTKEECEAKCSSSGDPHYTTFDGLSYEFLGSCSYFLVFVNESFHIIQEAGPCSEGTESGAYCTQSIKITYNNESILLKPGIQVTINERDTHLPIIGNRFSVLMPTNIFVKVNIDNGLSLLWDGENRIYVYIPPTFFGQTMGLCGTFNHVQNDDFLTPDRIIEAEVETFASKWQASDVCSKRSRRSSRSPCESQPQKLDDAKMLCSAIKQDVFKDCHAELDPDAYYRGCVNDLCHCGDNLKQCLCPILADYSLSCAEKGIKIDWIDEISACKLECPGEQVYQECSNPCRSSCAEIASDTFCTTQCIQGCACPHGMTLNSEGFCIAIDQCPCIYEDKEFPPSSTIVQGSKVCKCESAQWQCHAASLNEIMSLSPDQKKNSTSFIQCNSEEHLEFTSCLEQCPRTCQNSLLPLNCELSDCKPGCRCLDGFIFDTDKNKCVPEDQCSCMHGNKQYEEGSVIKQSCNLCTCKSGLWQCTEKLCPGICTSWGESHFKTFDGKLFDFHGSCDYIVAKGKMSGASFSLSAQNVPCGTSGITCSKSFIFELGPSEITRGDVVESVGDKEKLILSLEEPVPNTRYNSRFVVIESGLFVLVYTDIGISLQWDKGTRLYVTLDPKWRERVKGLCGNFNDDQTDDFLTPSGGIPETRASIFADSWKIHEYCPQPQTIEDACELHPLRKSWAQQKCGILKSDVFANCWSEVPLDPFYERCVFDSCACDTGGDCDCLCTAIATYAYECSLHGIPIKWRSQELCPIQCEECSTYDGCVPSCPPKTCENEFLYEKISENCLTGFCMEGCKPKPCPPGQIYNNGREYKCVPQTDCVVPCLEINGIVYNEGDRITDVEIVDACQSCHCLKGSISCSGNPCANIEAPRPCFQTGWTPWMNTPSLIGGDYEELSDPLLKSVYQDYCGTANMTNIECRVADTKTLLRETGQKATCTLPLGLSCHDNEQDSSICKDYEIRVFCDCGPQVLIETTPITTTTLAPKLPPQCKQTGWTDWMSANSPSEEGESETLENLRMKHSFCSENEIVKIECRSILSWRYIPGDAAEVICNKKFGLLCKGPKCDDYEVRVYCNCEIEETSLAPVCVTGWTEYFNTDHPDQSETGDDETLERIRELHQFCVGGIIEDIECKTRDDSGNLIDYSSLDTFGLKCSKNVGFVCNKYVVSGKCKDFMVRFYCRCEPVPMTTETSTTEAAQAPTTVLPVPVECGWTPWLNIDSPESSISNGDFEDLTKIQSVYKTCGGKDLIDIECRMSRTLHSYKESLQKNLVCDTMHGFQCKNEDQIGKCYDYEIRLLCMYEWCLPVTSTVYTTPVWETTTNPCPPNQIYDECAYSCEQLCSSFAQDLSFQCKNKSCISGCRPITGCLFPNVWRDFHTCVSKDECTCMLIEEETVTVVAPKEVVVKDCEKCQCIHDDLICNKIPGCGEKLLPEPRIEKENILKPDCWTDWINSDRPWTGGGDLETLSKINQEFVFCSNPVKAECRTVESKQKSTDTGQILRCDEKGLVCLNKDNMPEECHDYEIRFFCPCPTQIPEVTTPAPTLPPGPCIFGWSDWFNSHTPNNRGDFETIQSSRTNYLFCSNDMISAIECRRVGHTVEEHLQQGVLCDLQVGLICSQESLSRDETCWDYEIRFFCDCPTIAPFTASKTRTTTALPTRIACSYWSEWINENHPSDMKGKGIKKGVKGAGVIRGDNEKVMLLRLQTEHDFCREGSLSNIECRDSVTDLDYTETGDKKLTCNLISGFKCRGKDQLSGFCKDYKIRYFCSCNEVSTTPIITQPISPQLNVAECDTFYNIRDGPVPLSDANIKASSSKDSNSGPQSSHLNSISNHKSAGAWIAGDINKQQWIEVDLGEIQPVYGVVTKGRNAFPSWVKSYKVLYSRNGLAYAYISDQDNSEKVFTGNYDSETPVQNLFRKPVETRFIRIQPITFYKEIAMRVDVLGCAEGLTTAFITTIATPPPCIDEMGLYSGHIHDFQIQTSSNRNPYSDGRFVRLNSLQTEEHSGGWVAEDLDENQYVQIDFLEPRILTGVKTQGRDMVPQWITAFTVSYSQDGDTWIHISNSHGVKVFSGNYDSSTVAITYFPQAIRARFIRINPVSWENWIAMRIEILGCQEEVKNEAGTTRKPHVVPDKCIEPMGFENHQLPDTLITVSSSDGDKSGASRIRLNTHREGNAPGGWVPASYDYQPVVLIDFYGKRNLTGILTQGREDKDMWIMSYKVMYSVDNVTWEYATDMETDNIVFSGNRDRNSIVLRLFSSMIQAHYLKIIILDWHNLPAMRMEIWGCFIPYPTITIPPPTFATTAEPCVENSPWISLSDPAISTFGDKELIKEVLSAVGTCSNPFEIECRTVATQTDYTQTGQLVSCDLTHGLICENKLQSSSLCYNYEVRIKCWTCDIPTTAPVSLCPEIPDFMKEYCPETCPVDYSCDGSKCVPHIDCPCFNGGKTFNASNIIITNECHRCECILGGYSTCEPIKCPNCLPGQKMQIDDHCNCNCLGCAEGTVLCPSNGICIKEEQWCDRVKDCADDETDCPTTPTVPTLPPSTTEPPAICNTEYELGTDNCEMTANLFETFDGLSYQYDICHHVLLAEYPQNLYSVEVHKTCLSSGINCYKYLVIEVDSLTVKIGPGIEDVTIQDNKVLPSNFWLVSQRFQDFELKKRGNVVVFRSKKYHFDVSWDTLQNAKITVSKCLVGQIFGLCGLYNREMADDRTMPNGELAISNEKFGNSWAIGSLEKCQPASCPPELLRKAIEVCSELREEPFNSSCTDFVKIENRIEACLLFICECEQRTVDARNLPDGNFDMSQDSFDIGSCKCQAYDGFVEACESKGNTPIPEWRIKYDCTPECPPGMEWQDCGPGCELTCDNYQQREQLCGMDCVPGCYCPSGLIRHHNRCVKPKMCQDCICRGHGDPNYITFDGHYYAFQGNCTYILAQHQQADDQVMNFRILVTNVECPEEPKTSCTDGLTILWNGHTIEKFKNKPVYLDSKQLNAEDTPVEHDGISIIFVPGKSTVIHIKEINLVVRYFDQMYGFNIELPAFFYFNKTEGLCGVCNFIESDDLYHRNGYVTENVEDFAYSWLEPPNTKENCEFPREKVPEPPPGICNFTASSCELFLDPSLYARSCENDVTYSRKPESSMCRSKFQYSQQCCERGVSLVDWLLLSGCETSCPEGMIFDCTSACPKTCNNYKDYHVDDCDLMPLYTCTCPPGQVLKLGRCIDESKCEVCDNEGHVVGDEWSVGACKTCLCAADLNTICTVVECPEPPICDSKETLQKLSKSANSCCDAFICLPMAEKMCTNRELEDCPAGEANVQTVINGCPEYRCECMPELCPPIVAPLLEEGEEISLYTSSCCPEYKTVCIRENCPPPPLCAPGFRLSTFEGRCCSRYTCVPKKDICAYQHTYKVLNGSQIDLEPVEFYVKEYELGSSWHDGLCKECFCIDSDGRLTFTCREEICPDVKEFPDIESYVYEETRLPGICCPKFHRTSCLVNEKIYEIGEEWPSADGDKCKSYQCVTDEKGEAIRLEKTTTCDEICPENAIYVKASPESSKCCGTCKAVACEENGILYEDGATWISTTKPCFTAKCTANEHGTLISYRGESCPVMPDDCPPENVKTDPHGCCSYCKESKVTCSVVQVPIYETRGYFSYVDTKKGTCTNEQVLPDLTKCSGTCTTESYYSNLIGDFQSVCNCCLPTLVEDRSILLDCTDGTQVEKIYKQPFSCQCSSCSGPGKKSLLETLNQVEPY